MYLINKTKYMYTWVNFTNQLCKMSFKNSGEPYLWHVYFVLAKGLSKRIQIKPIPETVSYKIQQIMIDLSFHQNDILWRKYSQKNNNNNNNHLVNLFINLQKKSSFPFLSKQLKFKWLIKFCFSKQPFCFQPSTENG